MAVRAALADPGAPGGVPVPSLIGHELGVAAYILVACLAWRAYQRSVRGGLPWVLVVIAFAALAIERQFGLFAGLVDLVRGVSREEHWYLDRRPVQREFIAGVAALAAGIAALVLMALRREAVPLRVAALGAIALAALALVRAISLHSLDAMLGAPLLRPWPLSFGNGLELGALLLCGLACLAVPPLRARVRRRPSQRRTRRS